MVFRIVHGPVFPADKGIETMERGNHRVVGDVLPVRGAGFADQGDSDSHSYHASGGYDAVGLAYGA